MSLDILTILQLESSSPHKGNAVTYSGGKHGAGEKGALCQNGQS